MQRLLKCCMRAALSSAVLELPAKCSRAPRAACGYGALVQRFTAHRYSAAAGDALRTCLPSQSMASYKSVAAIKNVAKKYEIKLWQKLATTIIL
jgi:hypothetical protein